MIDGKELRRHAGKENLDVSMLEKDYILGWLLFAIMSSSLAGRLAFKGGTALSKVYFPTRWRLSEDLDFTLLDNTGWKTIIETLKSEIPKIVKDSVGIEISLRRKPHANPDYLQAKMKYVGPINTSTIKIEITREVFVGDIMKKQIPRRFDYPKFSVNIYTLETLVAEKMRAIIERGYVRDYYDVWRLLKIGKFDKNKIKKLFSEKCKGKGVEFTGIEQFFPKDIINTLEPHLEIGLTRLGRGRMPSLQTIIGQLRESLEKLLK
jgi:predicted nucleotidyltransferase component of viral defense system